MRSFLLPFLLLAACGGGDLKTDGDATGTDGDDTDTAVDDTGTDTGDTADTDDTEEPCTATVTGLSPADGSVDVSIDTEVVATFSDPVTAADIAVRGVNGTVTIADDGTSAIFTPDDLLDRDSTYVVTANVCSSTLTGSFTTVGEAPALDLAGRTYDVELDGTDITWVKPSQEVGELLMTYVTTTSILIGVESADETTIDLVGAAGFDFHGELRQYPCTAAIDFDPASFAASPSFSVGPVDTSIGSSSMMVDVYGLGVDGAFAGDAESLEDVTITGSVDTRPIADSTGMDVCPLLSALYGVSCGACPDGATACLELEVLDRSAPWRDAVTIDPDLDPTADPYCSN